MKSNIQAIAIIIGLTLSLSSCAGPEQISGPVVTRPVVSQSKPTQLIPPTDKAVETAMNEALPTIKKILSIHKCLTNNEGLRQMNFYAVPGADMTKYQNVWDSTHTFGLPIYKMEYHNKNKCLSVQVLDKWTKPALNALTFRAIYFADDSGETSSFKYTLKKMDDSSWKLDSFAN